MTYPNSEQNDFHFSFFFSAALFPFLQSGFNLYQFIMLIVVPTLSFSLEYLFIFP